MNCASDDNIAPHTRQKLQVLRKYCEAYSTIFANQPRLHHRYIDAFASTGQHIDRLNGEVVIGSPVNALRVKPPFEKIDFIELDSRKASLLRSRVGNDPRVIVHEGDANQLLRDIIPQVAYERFWRGLCFLDPYGLNLDWEVIHLAGSMKTIDLFINFPIMDANRNALRKSGVHLTDDHPIRMTRIWGDDSWKELYSPNLFGELIKEGKNFDVANRFAKRLKDVAGFAHVPDPLDLRNRRGSSVFFLFFASHNATGAKIAREIFAKARKEQDHG